MSNQAITPDHKARPLRFTEVRLPGVLKADLEGPYDLLLKPGGPMILRAVFEGDLPLQQTGHLVFRMQALETSLLRADIIRGDIGYPTVQLVNGDGCVFRFARGNLKDFFDISRPSDPQTVRLPLSAFVYDTDLKSNPPLTGDFFAPGIVMIRFDFLRHADKAIPLRLSDLAYLQVANGGAATLDLQDLVEFRAYGQSSLRPCFATSLKRLNLAMSLSRIAMSLGYAGCRLRLRLMSGDTELDRLDMVLHDDTSTGTLVLPDIGGYRLKAELYDDAGTVRARAEWPVTRVPGRPPRHLKPTILGISDPSSQEQIAAAGGSWDRVIVTLQQTLQIRGSFRFKPGLDPLSALPPGPGRSRIMAVFAMPRWLSRRPDATDFYRYGPHDWGLYRDLVGWLAEQARASGVTHYEIWNEATALGHWNGGFDEMLRLHAETRDAVRQAAPDMRLLGGCTHSWTFEYLEQFLAAGGAETCDGLALHGYTYQPDEYVDSFDRLDAMLATHCAARPGFGVHISEIGFRAPAFSLDAQADWFTLFTLEAAARDRVRALLWFRYTNPRPEISSGYRQNSSSGYALVGHQNSYCRPAYGAYVFLHGLLQQADEITADGPAAARRYTVRCGGLPIAQINGGERLAATPADWPELKVRRLDPETPGRVHIRIHPDWIGLLG